MTSRTASAMKPAFKLAVLPALALWVSVLGCPSSAPAPLVDSFTATPASIHPGQTTTLAWAVESASSIAIDNGVGVVTGNSTVVSPTQTTNYTLTATGLGGTASASATVTVGAALGSPTITAFTASPPSVSVGGTTKLSWTVTGTPTALAIDQGVGDVTGFTSRTVTVNANTTYTLSATNASGVSNAQVSVTTHPAQLHLQYTDPSSGAAQILLVQNPTSSGHHLILDVKVGAANIAPAAGGQGPFGVALTIPIDSSGLGKVDFVNTNASALGGILPGTITVGTSPATTAAASLVTAGPLQNMLVVGVAKRKVSVGDGTSDTWPAGTVLFSLVFDLDAAASPATFFTAAQFGANPKSRATVLTKAGKELVGKAGFAIGDFIVAL